MTRPWDYSCLACLRSLHKTNFCFNVCKSETQQKKLLQTVVQKWINMGRVRANESKPPMKYEVCMLLENKIWVQLVNYRLIKCDWLFC